MKKLIKMVAVLLVLLVLATVAVAFYIDTIAKTTIERGATYALGVETTLGSADVGLLSGTFSMEDLKVANPAGFETPHFTHLQDGRVEVALGSLRKETVELPTLTLSGLDIHLDKSEGKANYDVILDNLSRFESGDDAEKEADGKKFVINEVLIQRIVVHVQLLPIGGDLTKLDVPIDEVRLRNVGSDSDHSVLMSELTSVIIKAVLAAIVQKGGDLIPADVLGDLGQGLAGLESLTEMGVDIAATFGGEIQAIVGDFSHLAKPLGSLGPGLEGAAGGLDEVTEGIGDAIKNIGEGFGGRWEETRRRTMRTAEVPRRAGTLSACPICSRCWPTGGRVRESDRPTILARILRAHPNRRRACDRITVSRRSSLTTWKNTSC